MTKIIATHFRNINETFIGIFIGIPLRYIAWYHHDRDYYVKKINKIYYDKLWYRMSTISISG